LKYFITYLIVFLTIGYCKAPPAKLLNGEWKFQWIVDTAKTGKEVNANGIWGIALGGLSKASKINFSSDHTYVIKSEDNGILSKGKFKISTSGNNSIIYMADWEETPLKIARVHSNDIELKPVKVKDKGIYILLRPLKK
jgi:hypothetical protein